MRRSLPAPARSRAATALAAGTLLLTVSACGDEGSPADGEGEDAPTSLDDVADVDDFAAYLSTFPGVEEVEAADEATDDDVYHLNADVGVSDDATPAQILSVIEAVQVYGEDGNVLVMGEDRGGYDNTPEISLHHTGEEDHRISTHLEPDLDPTPLVTTFVTAVDSATLDAVGWSVGREAEVQVDEASLPDTASVTALAEEIAADPALAPIEGWLLPSDQDAVPRAYLATRIGMTDEVVAAWAALTAEPGDDLTLAAATLTPRLAFGQWSQDPPPLDSFLAEVGIDPGDDVAPASVTEAEYGELLLPLIEAHIAALGSLPSDEDTYELNHRRDYEDTLLAELPLSDDPEWRPGKRIDPAWQEAVERAAG